MSGKLSFTQELRQQGLIISETDTTNQNNISTEQVNENNDNTIENETYDTSENETYDTSLMYIGKKPSMNYVLAINSRMSEGLDEITIKARGKTISKAVDVAEIVTNRFIPDANDDQVKISTEEVIREDGNVTNVSTIEIVIKK